MKPPAEDETVDLDLGSGTVAVLRRARRVWLKAEGDYPFDELARALPQLIEITVEGHASNVLEFVRSPAGAGIRTLKLFNHRFRQIDVTDSQLILLTATADDLESCHVDPPTQRLTLEYKSGGPIRTHIRRVAPPPATDDFRLFVYTSGPLAFAADLEIDLPLGGFSVDGASPVSLADIAARFPQINALWITAYTNNESVELTDIERLVDLPDLRLLHLVGAYNLTGDDLADAIAAHGKLDALEISRIRRKAGNTLRKRMEAERLGHRVSIISLLTDRQIAARAAKRKAEPAAFANWDLHYPPAMVKAAVNAYRRCADAISADRASAEAALLAFVETFNQREGDIDTPMRDDICVAFFALAARAGIADDVAQAWQDERREF